ncbi:VCBS repeat-containing protein, partial [Labrenzia sp. EL_126]|nr:VCBS repeat-containing protein [Labrenzia sp. EL_126]
AADTFGFTEDTALVGENVLADNGNGADSDLDLDPLTVSLVTDVTDGSLVLNGDGSFTYTPDADFDGTDSFTYQISDGRGGTDQAIVTLNGTPVNDPANAANDGYATDPNGILTVSAAQGVLANDSDPEGDAFTIVSSTDPSNGSLTLNSDGSFTYTPNAGFTGTDSFTYQVTGGDAATVTLNVDDGIPVVSGLVAAYESFENVGVSGDNTVAVWLDGSGRGNDLVASGDPTLVAASTPTGEAAIVFDGVGDLLERVDATDGLNGLPSGSADRTMFFVVNYIDDEGVSSGLVYGDGAQNQTFGLVTARDEHLEVQGWGSSNDFDSSVDGLTQGWMVQSVIMSENTFTHYQDGVVIDSDTHIFETDLQRLLIGAEINDKGESTMEVASALIYDRALSDTERGEVESYLQQLYIDDQFLF